MSPPTIFRADAVGLPLLADTTEIDIPYHQAVLITSRRYLDANDDPADSTKPVRIKTLP